MRTGGYTVQQALTPEAATILKQALTLAKRRGHAQVTPLHVAHTMLSSPTGLFRTACLQSHSHPLQCKALELCFNVALNRLPTSSSNPVFGSHSLSHPSISNALVAAFKRAQAHQRRGSIESQQQPLIAVKIEIEQLIISILDDPSVSRVMREARFSSTQVKINIEKVVSLELCSQTSPAQNKNLREKDHLVLSPSPTSSKVLGRLDGNSSGSYQTSEKDVGFIIENMLKNKRNIVIVSETVDTLELLVREFIEKIDKGDVHEGFKEVKFITLPLLSLGHLSREEVEQKLEELKSILKKNIEKEVVLYLGDLKWISEYRANSSCDQGTVTGQYCHVEHMVTVIGKLGCGIGESGRFSILGVACFETYQKCNNGSRSLKSIWRLNPITFPDESLNLGLIHGSDTGTSSLRSGSSISQLTTSSLPLWLQKYKDDNNFDQGCVPRSDICERTISFNSVSPSCFTNSFCYDINRPSYEPYPNSTPYSTSSNYFMEVEHVQSYKELNYENFKALCTSLEQEVASQKDIIPEIASTILQCRSKMKTTNGEMRKDEAKEETWMCFQGVDVDAKEKIARELAKIIFGSSSNFVSITLSSFPCATTVSAEDMRNERSKDDQSGSILERFSVAVSHNPHRVFFLEDIEKVDYYSQLGLKKAIEKGSVRDSNGKEIRLSDAIVILSCKNFDPDLRTCSPYIKQKLDNEGKERVISLDLNVSLIEDTEKSDNETFVDIGLLECVDRRIIFRHQVL